ncbi:MAG: amidohydrolase family protein [Bryobacteraceae bacterium]
MAAADWPVQDHDREFFARHLHSFIPERVFDAHTHLYRTADFHGTVPQLAASGPAIVDWECFERHMRDITPGRRYGALCFPFPAKKVDTPAGNEFLAAEVARSPLLRGQMMIEPGMDPEYVRETVRRHRFVGLKCYHLFAPNEPTFEAPVEDYLTEEHVRIAHEEGLSITLHMVRARAMADPVNQEAIARLARKYPNSRWILAHAARGFNPHHTIEGIGSLRGISNIWCDTSAVTEAGAFEAIVRTLGVDRLLYGADFPVTHIRGRCVAIGDSFLWLGEDNTAFGAKHGAIKPILIILESLRALKQACWNLNLSDSDVEKIFWGNAVSMYSVAENALQTGSNRR